jgi:putative two-component system response regulator
MSELTDMRLLIIGGDVSAAERLRQLLAAAGYTDIVVSSDPATAHHLARGSQPDVVVLDLGAPGPAAEQAADLIRHLTAEADSPAVLVICADRTPQARHRALSLGARDFVAEPIDADELLLRVNNALHTRQLQQQLKDRSAIFRERTSELDAARVESLSILTAISEYHDDDTGQHSQRVGICAALIARALGLPESFVSLIRDAAPLHDIGKVGISRKILLKPGKLTPSEWIHMQRHVEIGAQILSSARSPELRLAAEIARTHHERWDGNGYDAGLAGEDIPISGRITAVADVWDTLTHQRPYKPAWDEQDALAEIHGQAGHHFDPRVAAAFATIDRRVLSEPAADVVSHAA